jgi:chromosome segregation ATPase
MPALIVIILVLLALARETYKKNQIQREIESLQEKARQIDRENADVQEKISYLESRDYQEKEAKDKFNLQEPNENVVVIRPGIVKEIPPEEIRVKNIIAEEKRIINPLKWWQYFFKN